MCTNKRTWFLSRLKVIHVMCSQVTSNMNENSRMFFYVCSALLYAKKILISLHLDTLNKIIISFNNFQRVT